ncbi:type I restriction-modification system subunit M [Ktedonobacter robiniae]|uniref:site-specific DNA-methyltransferase (adenine-specific) n=1 Tax=Ktedonobacter robiniae TaxID=2778365 RepID=A0ABQ3UUK9_9CHLR|nr:class I SAM-dependent DNA methyltransferase [Ktedonobacter robiniae]GHO56067.1 membrane protein [Ktedonobacter robiniae]
MATKLEEIEKRLWAIADDLRANSGLKASEYSEPVLGLIFLRFASERFKKVTAEIQAEKPAGYEITDDDYLERGALVLPQYAQFDELLKLPESTNMGKIINQAMGDIEEKNEDLKGALPKSFTRLSTSNIFALLKALDSISFDIEGDVFGKVYEYFLGEFAMAEGQRGGQFFTPTSIVQLIVEIIEPFKGRIFDPACGSGGMFVQSARFVRNHQRQADDISIWGQEIMEETVRLCRMNLAVNGLPGNITFTNSLYGELHKFWGQFDFVMANPPFNLKNIDKVKLQNQEKRYPFGIPNINKGNYFWIQMFYSALKQDKGRAGFVMASSASDAGNSELAIRRQLLQTKSVDVIISISSNFFYTVTLPCTLWFLDKGKRGTQREDTVLFINAQQIYRYIDRTHREFWPEDIEFIANIVRLYRGEEIETVNGSQPRVQETFLEGKYSDIPGLCKVATLKEIEEQGGNLNPGRYVGIAEKAFEDFDFMMKLEELNEELEMLNLEARELETRISENMISLLEGKER